MFVTGEIYHVYSKSIADFKIFNNDFEYQRINKAMQYYQVSKRPGSFSNFLEYGKQLSAGNTNNKLVQIISYCPMPTHLHFTLKQLIEKGISTFMSNVLNSYTRYFNIKHNRKGPLWEGRFKKVLVKSDEQLIHLTRYIHLNPVTAGLVNNPIDWPWSSYHEFINKDLTEDSICEYKNILDIKPDSYKAFTEDRASYQRELAKIKHILID
ncbi:MAG: transposase [Candidatus Omnitrophota bacterium]|nr:transposase [Candidatus Omnitrophota bacterium]